MKKEKVEEKKKEWRKGKSEEKENDEEKEKGEEKENNEENGWKLINVGQKEEEMND